MSSFPDPDFARFEQHLTESDMLVGVGSRNGGLSAVDYRKPTLQLRSGIVRSPSSDPNRVNSFRHVCAITPPRPRAHALE
jgi:hypothetical protein